MIAAKETIKPRIQKPAGRKVPWRLFLFLHVIIWASVINPKDVPFRLVADTVGALEQGRAEGLVGRRAALVLLAGICLVGLVTGDIRRLRAHGALGLLMVAFIAWSLLSLSWADDVSLTGRKLFSFCVFWAGAVWAALRFSNRDILLFGFFSNLLTAVFSVVAEVSFGLFRPWESGYRFAGLSHPNGTGQCVGVLVLACAALLYDERRRWRTLYVLTAGMGFVLLLLTGSRTALFCTIAGLLTVVTLNRARSPRHLATLALAFAWIGSVLLSAVVVFGNDVVDWLGSAALLGRSDYVGTLGLRTPMWKEVVERFIAARPFTGYGYGGFWTIEHTAAIAMVVRGMVYYHSHSGYLEMALSIGVIGAAVHVLTYLLALRIEVGRSVSGESASAFAAAIIVVMLLVMLTETMNLNPPVMPSFLAMIIIAKCAFVVSDDASKIASRRNVRTRKRPAS